MGLAYEEYEDAMSCYETESADYYRKKLEHAAEWFCYLDTLLRSIGPLPTEIIERSLEEMASALDCNISNSPLNIQAVK